MAIPAISEVKEHLEISTTDHDAELTRMLGAAVELVAHEIQTAVDVTGRPALHLAVVELVRDLWTGTQTARAVGGGALPEDDEAVSTLGRPALPPYVRALLAPYVVVPVPAFAFPAPAPWPEF